MARGHGSGRHVTAEGRQRAVAKRGWGTTHGTRRPRSWGRARTRGVLGRRAGRLPREPRSPRCAALSGDVPPARPTPAQQPADVPPKFSPMNGDLGGKYLGDACASHARNRTAWHRGRQGWTATRPSRGRGQRQPLGGQGGSAASSRVPPLPRGLSLTRGAWGEEEIFVTWTNWSLSKQICLTQEKTDARRARTQTAAASSAQGAEPPGTLVA